MPTVNAAEFVRAFKNASLFASTDKARPLYTAVLLEQAPDALRFVGTDSYGLSVETIPAAYAPFEEFGPVMLSALDSKIFLPLFAPKGYSGDLAIRDAWEDREESKRTGSDEKVTRRYHNVTVTSNAVTFPVDNMEATYLPDYRQIVPTENAGISACPVLAIGAFQLARLAKVVPVEEANRRGRKRSFTPVKVVHVVDSNQAFVATIGEHFTAVMMPVRVN